ncbi:MAG: hypothetical protein AAB885_00305, partial [Patescibacteria group bacterium]
NPDFSCQIFKNDKLFFNLNGGSGFLNNIVRDIFPYNTPASEAVINLVMKSGNQICATAQLPGSIGSPPPPPEIIIQEPVIPSPPSSSLTVPEVLAPSPTLTQSASSWFLNQDSLAVPGQSIDVHTETIFLNQLGVNRTARLRLGILVEDGPFSRGKKFFKLQYTLAPYFSGGVYAGQSTCNNFPDSAWRDVGVGIGDNVSFNNNPNAQHGSVPIQNLYDPRYFNLAIPQTYVEYNSFTNNGATVSPIQLALFDFSLRISNLAPTEADWVRFRAGYPQYFGPTRSGSPPATRSEACFRVVNSNGTHLNGGYTRFPRISI